MNTNNERRSRTGKGFIRTLLVLMVMGAGMSTNGQTGIRFTCVEFERTSGKFQPNIIFGFDRDVASKLSIGLEVVKSFRFDPGPAQLTNGSHSYSILRDAWGLQYRSQYFITDAMYMGSTIGFRQVSFTVEPDYYSYSSNPVQTHYRQTGETTVVPLGIRFGFRSDLDGWYNDVYIQLGYNVGSGKNIMRNADYLNNSHLVNPLWFNAGYAFGFGW